MATTSSRRLAAAVVGGALLLEATANAEPRVYTIGPDTSQIRFHAVSRFMDADGTFHRFAGEIRVDPALPETAAGQVEVEVASLDTGIGLRDRHLRSDEFFDVARYPRATFVIAGGRREGDRVAVTGDLTIRGVTRRITVPVALAIAEGTLRATGELSLNRLDFGVAYQSRLNPIGDEVRVRFDLVANAR